MRALGVAESYRGETSILTGAVVTGSRVVDGFSFAACTVGGLDADDAVCRLYDALDRADVRYLLVSGIAPAWYNILDLRAIHRHVDRPVLSVSFEESDGLEAPIREAFDGETADRRLEIYRAQPPRERMTVNDQELFVRSVGLEDEEPATVVKAFTPVGGRPEPVRVARLAARGLDSFRHREELLLGEGSGHDSADPEPRS